MTFHSFFFLINQTFGFCRHLVISDNANRVVNRKNQLKTSQRRA